MSAHSCELCEAARITPWYHEDEICWVAECEICAVPMVVWRVHGTDPDETTRSHMFQRLGEAVRDLFGEDGWRLDDKMRQIPDHFHAHARRQSR